jgi:hypothetical protein
VEYLHIIFKLHYHNSICTSSFVCVTLKKTSQKPQIHVKPTTYFKKQCTDVSRIEREYDLATVSVAPPTVAEIANSTTRYESLFFTHLLDAQCIIYAPVEKETVL